MSYTTNNNVNVLIVNGDILKNCQNKTLSTPRSSKLHSEF